LPAEGRRAAAAATAIATLLLVAPGTASAVRVPGVAAPAYLLVDDADGSVLASSHPDERRPIASITKLMTGYLVAARHAPLSTTITVPAEAAVIGESSLGLTTGERVTLGDLWAGLLVQSANDAADTMAVWDAGSQAAFVSLMNRTAARLGLRSTVYAAPYGLDRAGQYSTARDQLRLARLVMRDAVVSRYAGMRSATVLGHTYPSRNTLLSSYPGLDGVKTGHTSGAGWCLIGSATRNGHRLFAVALGTADATARDRAVSRLLDFGFSRFRTSTPVRAGGTVASIPVAGRKVPLALRAARPVTVTVRSVDRVSERFVLPAAVTAPVAAGQTLGRVDVLLGGRVVGSSPLVAANATAPPARGVVSRVEHALSSLF
jgi:serine-type D-Ala-D-Ala carboxypeptidase (penicillin-binding protein 5/6)